MFYHKCERNCFNRSYSMLLHDVKNWSLPRLFYSFFFEDHIALTFQFFSENLTVHQKMTLSFIFLNTSHKFWDQPPTPNYHCCLQVSEIVSWWKLRCSLSFNILQYLVGGRGLIYFYKVENSRIFINFSRNFLGLNNVCEKLSQKLRRLGK